MVSNLFNFHYGFTFVQLFIFLTLSCARISAVDGQTAYTRHLSDDRIQELQKIAILLNHSINPEKYACESYFDYVCSKKMPLFSVMGNLPGSNDLINLLSELQDDPEQFMAKQKVTNFFISCNILKSVDDCYRETFEYFKPFFAYIIAKNHIDMHDHKNFLEVLERFIAQAEHIDDFGRSPTKFRLDILKDKFQYPRMYFRIDDMNREYDDLKIYRESYYYNVKNLERYRKRNSTYDHGVPRTILNWTMYLYQSHNKPMSYYFSTLNVHLWMVLYNTTAREWDLKHFTELADCLKLPSYVNVLNEGRFLAVIYLKSFQNAWQGYRDWITSSTVSQEIFDHENEILKQYSLNNKRIFFTIYAQNFCDFGKELAENIFYLGLKQNHDFFSIYSCGFQTTRGPDCV